MIFSLTEWDTFTLTCSPFLEPLPEHLDAYILNFCSILALYNLDIVAPHSSIA